MTKHDRVYAPSVYSPLLGTPEYWDVEAAQYAHLRRSKPGLMYFRGRTPEWAAQGRWVDCLLCYRRHGYERKGPVELVGVLNHFPVDFPESDDRAGDFTVFVAPWFKRQGVATALLSEAHRRWTIDLDQQKFTVEGAAFINAFIARHGWSK